LPANTLKMIVGCGFNSLSLHHELPQQRYFAVTAPGAAQLACFALTELAGETRLYKVLAIFTPIFSVGYFGGQQM
jgi:hypothetical protein